MPVISVVMPVFNQEKYVADAVQCILDQSFKDFEFVIVDDGSTDHTPEILACFGDQRIRIISLPNNQGFRAALETGIKEANGEWIARMDSDDLCSPLRLTVQTTFLKNHPDCLLVGTSYGLITPHAYYLRPRKRFAYRYLQAADLTCAQRVFADPSAVFHRQTALDTGLYDDESDKEIPLWYRLLAVGKGVELDEPLYWYRLLYASHSRPELSVNNNTSFCNLRRKYDPANAAIIFKQDVPGKKSTRNNNARLLSHWLLYKHAGDHRAARYTALRMLRGGIFHKHFLLMIMRILLGDFFPMALDRARSIYLRVNSPW